MQNRRDHIGSISGLSGGGDVKLIGHWKELSPVLLDTFRATSFWPITLPLTRSLSLRRQKACFPPAIFKESPCALHLPVFILNHDIMSSSFHLIVSQVNSYPGLLSACHVRVEGEPNCSSCAGGGDRTISGDDEAASYRRVINGRSCD